MFIKLNFTENKDLWDIFRILTDIINTPSVSSVSALQTRITQASYNAELISGFDATNSEIIRSVSPTTTKAHFCRESQNSSQYAKFRFTMEMVVHDAPDTKMYLQYYNSQTSNNYCYFSIADGITGGTITSSQQALSESIFITSSPANRGTLLTLTGTPYDTNNLISTSSFSTIRTFWAYITDKSFVWCATLGTSYTNGWGTTYNNAGTFMGPYVNSMYTRYDYWNQDSNGIIPFMYSNPRGNSVGYGNTTDGASRADFTTPNNSMYTSNQAILPMRVFNIVDAHPAVTTSFPIVYHPPVNVKLGGRSEQFVAHTYSLNGTASTAATSSYGRNLAINAAERWPTTDLSGTGFMNQPIGWENSYRGCHGGNLSEQASVYIFNGDYQPGDVFSLGGKIYMIWPMYGVGYASRIGLSVPKE